MDWGIGQGYMGLFSTTNKREAAKDELSTLTMLDQQMKLDRAEKEQAQMKEQAYYAEISKAADQLLTPDRNKINERSRLLAGAVREQVKMYGGDLTKFFANGGHKVLSDYKSAILNSEETSMFMDNKKNMERILEMQSKGMGHLINQTDLYNLQNYQEKGSGRITFTGMLNQIELPDLENWDKGEAVPAEAILAHSQNRLKFLGNYKMTYPSADYPPNEAELKRFVSETYGNLKGTNWQRPLKYKEVAFNQQMQKAGHDLQVAQFNEGNKQWYLNYDLAKDKQKFDQNLSLEELEIEKMKNGIPSIYGEAASSGATDGMTAGERAQLAEDSNTWPAHAQQMFTDIDYQVNEGGGKVSDKIWDKYALLFGKQGGFDSFEQWYNDYSKGGSGGLVPQNTILGRAVKRLTGAPGYKVRGGKFLMNGDMAAAATKELLTYNTDGTVKVDLSRMQNAFDASGTRVNDYKEKNKGKGLIFDNYNEDLSQRNFNVKGIVGGFTTQDANGKTVLLMDKKSGNKDYDERLRKGAQKRAGMFILLESDKGDTIYQPIEDNFQMTVLSKWAGSNLNAVSNSRKYGAKASESIRFNTNQQKAAVAASYNKIKSDPAIQGRLVQQVRMIPGASTAGTKYVPLSFAFYSSISARDNVGLNDAVEGDAFNQIMSHMSKSKPQSYKNLQNMIKDGRTNQKQIIDFIQKEGYIEKDFADDWKNSFSYINSIK